MERLSRSEKENPWSKPQNGRGALVSGAWIGNLTVLEPYRPIFIGAALVALFFAYRRIFRPAQACKPGEVCAVPQVKTAYKTMFWIVAAMTGIALAFPYILPLFY
jgi:mercuric ion transport protein